MTLNRTEAERQELRDRLTNWLIVVCGAFAFLLIRFWFLQVVQYEVWRNVADTKRIRHHTIAAMRGNIYDRKGLLLADYDKSYNVTVTPADLEDESLARLAQILSATPDELKERMEHNRSWSPFIPVLAAENLGWNKFARVREDRLVMPGVDTEIRPVRRYYSDSSLVSHVLGYMGEISRKELGQSQYEHYRMGDRIGRTGIESTLESALRGRDGVASILVDARGRELSLEPGLSKSRGRLDYKKMLETLKLMSRPVEPGQSVVLTLDLQLQRIARKHMGMHRGSVVAMDVRTGELLALLSIPGYDPSFFAGKISSAKWKELSESPEKPLFNRALQGSYPPASIFKIIVATAGLEEGVIRTDTTFECTGLHTLLDTKFGCWNRYGHGEVDLERGLVESCDVYFYSLGEKLGIEKIAKWARRFGLGSQVGLARLEEASGLVPDPAWKRKHKNLVWYPGETILVAIGQGYMLTTPLQAVLIPALVANNGRLMRPQIIHHLVDVRGRAVTRYQPQVMADRFISKKTIKFLRRSMEQVVEHKRGTAYKYVRSDIVSIAGKSGTAEVSKKYQRKPIEEIPYKYRDHAWFIAYAPAHDPRIAIVVMVEHGGSGGKIAGTIARKILDDYYSFHAVRRANVRAIDG